MTDHQLDILATNSDWFTLPRHLPGRLSAIDFVFFNWPPHLNPSRYTVVVEALNTSGAPYRGIGKLQPAVELPHVQYGWHSRIGVVPDSEELPVFEAELVRGSTYDIPDTRGSKQQRVQMRRHGKHAPPGL